MIQLRKKLAAPAPAVLTTRGIAARTALEDSYNAGTRTFTFNSSIYGHNDVKTKLIELQDGKCAFCESKITPISYGDVEHFRPKGGWVQDEEELNQPGYYWLAYDWENLILSCQICNQRQKKNYFPLIDPARRARSHNDDVRNEAPLFVHPVLDNPEIFITFKDEIPVAIDGNVRGATIQKLGIDRTELNEMRLSTLNPIRDLYNLAKSIPETTPEIKAIALSVVNKYVQESNEPKTQYSSMLRAFFRDNPLPAIV